MELDIFGVFENWGFLFYVRETAVRENHQDCRYLTSVWQDMEEV